MNFERVSLRDLVVAGGGAALPLEVPPRRQHPFGSIILDFYCPSLRFALEVDGATHGDDDARLRDAARDRWLAGQASR